eukprot:14268422-Ditylum_brightwellii.AAC.1
MNFETGERQRPSHPSRGGLAPEAKAKQEGEETPVGSNKTYKQDRAIAAFVYNNMRFISKYKGEVGEVTLPKALVMSLFQDEDVKKAIRAS